MTEPKFDLTEHLRQEYRDVSQTQFWKTFMADIVEKYGMEIKTLKVASIDRIPKSQGRISAFDYVLGLPDKIVTGTRNEKEE